MSLNRCGLSKWFGVLGLLVSGATLAAAGTCDRPCLLGFLDQYRTALVAHDPTRLPLSAQARYSENGQMLALGDGLWATAGSLGGYRLDIADVGTGQVGEYAVGVENGNPFVLVTRLRVEAGKISEIETIVARKAPGDVFTNPQNLTAPDPIFLAEEPVATRRSRSELIAIANHYFDGLAVDRSSAHVPFADDCNRIENGTQATNNPALHTGTGPWGALPSLSCKQQFDSGMFSVITRITPRRWLIVDETRGLAFVVASMHHAGVLKTVQARGIGTVPVGSYFDHPHTLLLGELFKISDGKIHRVNAVWSAVVYGASSGWN